ncbi:CotH kinase family protein [Maribacter hydrothermalis]|uniref:Spore coat protein n=1 Tax=Maribacter hydrothermalis TaxID=1836467 RepID=A0A1B7Z8T0_9FLAO|nr:CotH kinase family protein [Maribacter hydrothermalis]APQ19017.1 spore coat protein [Maribacter hydrothermalis]OBR38970.1 spore coat protein [Maribacter hydrothermalis]
MSIKNIKVTFPVQKILFFLFITSFIACSDDDSVNTVDVENEIIEEEDVVSTTVDDTDFEATDWTTATHSKDADPDFDEVFEDNAVKRLDIVITEARWDSMLENMTELYGTFGSSGQSAPGAITSTDEDPIFVPAEVFYEGKEWYRVGVRFKGNSSLQSTWQSGNLKLSLKLDFDEFEDDYPQIDNQRFYGFKKLSLKNNYDDKSMLREKVAADVFRSAGLAVSNTAFYTLYIDHGDGPIYFGLYTLVEEVDDTVIDEQFSDNDGNLYKPDGDAATFAAGTYDEDEYVKKTNEDEADFSDVESLLNIINDASRTTDAATWRSNLDAVLDTDVYLKYLATNTVIQNWDTYGRMSHNYYLYNNPDTGKLNWIPWDNNEALQYGKQQGAPELDFSDLTASQWPLISYLYNDAIYQAKYDTYVQEVIEGAFNETTVQELYASYSALVEPYATSENEGYTFLNSSADFQNAINGLNAHATSRTAAVNSYLNR